MNDTEYLSGAVIILMVYNYIRLEILLQKYFTFALFLPCILVFLFWYFFFEGRDWSHT